MALEEDSLHADPDERPPPLARTIEPRPRVALFGATLVYALLFAGLTADYRFAPRQEPTPQEIPIEIVPEPPPPPPPSPQQQEYLEPAYDAPRVAKTKGTDGDLDEKSEKAPTSPTEAQKPATEKTEAATEATKAPDLEPPAPDAPPAPVADGETPPPREARADPKPAEAPPAQSESSGVVFHMIDPGAEVMEALMAPGRAKLIYNTHLYGLILPQRHLPTGTPPRSFNPEGATIDFILDGNGRLTDRRVVQSSGWREFDVACVDSLVKASPSFPAPPHGAPVALEYHCSERRAEPRG